MMVGHFPELIIVLVLALVVFGPKRLPEVGAGLGKSIREFRKATSEIQEQFTAQPTIAPPVAPPYDTARGSTAPPPTTAADRATRPVSETEPVHGL